MLQIIVVKIEVQHIDVFGYFPAVVLKSGKEGRPSQFSGVPGFLASVIEMRSATSDLVNERMVKTTLDLDQALDVLDEPVYPQTATDKAVSGFGPDEFLVRSVVDNPRKPGFGGGLALRDP
ncbi:hypothetical protein [uncultured Tateyamaria sp.]|uniref:hypothetical protein n=1 Tax=uncultured Tateyamaria sp. TaxID=455651 RepID=UPI002624BB9A|nr:hypothetical protein [uncultured Tateyamaria sp.]